MRCPLKKVVGKEGEAGQLLEKYKNLGQGGELRVVKRGVQGSAYSHYGRMIERKNLGTRRTNGQEHRLKGEGGG